MRSHLGILVDAIGFEAATTAKTVLRRNGYIIYLGDPDREAERLKKMIRDYINEYDSKAPNYSHRTVLRERLRNEVR